MIETDTARRICRKGASVEEKASLRNFGMEIKQENYLKYKYF